MVLAPLLLKSCLLASIAIEDPSAITGYTRGADAVPLDPAAAADTQGVELSVRGLVSPGRNSIASFVTLPFGPLTLMGGYAWLEPTIGRQRRTSIGLGGGLPLMRIGLAYRRLHQSGGGLPNDAANALDVSVLSEPTRWLTLAAGLDAWAAGHLGDVRIPQILRLGAAVRPIAGAPWLTLAGHEHLKDEGGKLAHDSARAIIDVAPIAGLHLLGIFEHTRNEDYRVVGGLSLDLGGFQLRGITGPEDVQDGGGPWQTAYHVRAASAPRENLLQPRGASVGITLSDKLEPPKQDFFGTRQAISTTAITLQRLARHPDVREVVLHIERLDIGLATVDELRQAIHTMRRHGKKVIAQIAMADDNAYMVAAAADEIHIDPLGILNIDGFALRRHYFGDALLKLGVRFDSVEVGQYKTGADSLTSARPRPEELEVRREILDQAMQTLRTALVHDRQLPEAEIETILNKGVFNAQQAKAMGLVDDFSQPAGLPHVTPKRNTPRWRPSDLSKAQPFWGQQPIIAVVPITGVIVNSAAENPLSRDSAIASRIVQRLDRLADSPVAAVVLRIDSPGGDVIASEEIWRAVRRLASHKPVIASMGDIAASGGYYVAAPAHHIIAQPNTLTGSIGIFTVKLDLQGFYAWMGLHASVSKNGPHADWQYTHQPLSKAAKNRLRGVLQNYYQAFLERVSDGRNMTLERAKELAEGRVYTGARAQELGLVDTLGSINDAIALAKQKAGIPVDHDVYIDIPTRPGMFSELWQRWSLVPRGGQLSDAVLESLSQKLGAWDNHAWALMADIPQTE